MIITNLNVILESCKNSFNHKATLIIEKYISQYNKFFVEFNDHQRSLTLLVIRFIHIVYLVNAAASDDDIKHYIACAELN